MLLMTLFFDGPAVIVASFENLQWTTVGAVLYLVVLSTFFAYSVWGYLMNNYPAATVAPFSLLIPVVGFTSASLFLNEDFPLWKLGASVLVISGVAMNVFEVQIRRIFVRF
jgi:O-acetylserine/cysteine efflux transporter